MKTATAHNNYRRPIAYPNAATRRQTFNKFMDGLLLLASGAGVAAMIMFMLLFL